MKMQPVPVIPCREETTARVDVLRRYPHAMMHSLLLPQRGHARMPASLTMAVGSSSISHPSILVV